MSGLDMEKKMMKRARMLSNEYFIGNDTASLAVLSANLYRINESLEKINKNLESIIYRDEKRSFLNVCGVMDTYEQN